MINHVDLYINNLGPIVEITERIFYEHSKMIKWGQKAASVLDIGIGDGLVANEIIIPRLPRNFKEFIGCDISEEALDICRKRIKLPNFHLINMDIGSLDIPQEYTNRFDHVFCHRCLHNLHNIKDMRQAFRNIYKMLKPGGQFFISTFEESPLDQAYEILHNGKWRKYNHRQLMSCFYKYNNAVDDYKKIIDQEGFVDVYVQKQQDYFIPFTETAYEEAHICVNPVMSYVDVEDREAYIQDFMAAMKEGTLTQTISKRDGVDDIHIVTVKLIVAIASKPLL